MIDKKKRKPTKEEAIILSNGIKMQMMPTEELVKFTAMITKSDPGEFGKRRSHDQKGKMSKSQI